MAFEILGKYRNETEVLDTADTQKEADYLRAEYALAFGAEWSVWIKGENRCNS